MKNFHSHIFILVFSLAVSIFVFGAWFYMYRLIGTYLNQAANDRAAVSADGVTKSREKSFMDIYQKTSSKWSRLPDYFVPANNVVTFIETLEHLNADGGAKVTISGVSDDSADGAPGGTEGTVRAHITVDGKWLNVMKTLSLAESLPYKTVLSGVNLSVSNNNFALNVVVASSTAQKRDWSLNFDIQAATLVPIVATTTLIK
ncbi:MAG: hypothetical protein WCT02_01090 [Candidatus Paceibacterota bacterium]